MTRLGRDVGTVGNIGSCIAGDFGEETSGMTATNGGDMDAQRIWALVVFILVLA
jgi:hypothetical protein